MIDVTYFKHLVSFYYLCYKFNYIFITYITYIIFLLVLLILQTFQTFGFFLLLIKIILTQFFLKLDRVLKKTYCWQLCDANREPLIPLIALTQGKYAEVITLHACSFILLFAAGHLWERTMGKLVGDSCSRTQRITSSFQRSCLHWIMFKLFYFCCSPVICCLLG